MLPPRETGQRDLFARFLTTTRKYTIISKGKASIFLKSRVDTTEEKINEPEDISEDNTQHEDPGHKRVTSA